jgi:hypothetical protein
MNNFFATGWHKIDWTALSLLYKPNLKTMNHETKAKLKAALATGYILLTACLGIAFFGRFIFALLTN